MQKLKALCVPLGEAYKGKLCMGVKSGLTEAFVIDEGTRRKLITADRKCAEIIKPFLNGRDIRRYSIQSSGSHLIYTYHGVDIKFYPPIETHLRPFKEKLQRRATAQKWYELQQPQHAFATLMDKPKIVFPDIAVSPRFALDDGGHYGGNTTYFIAARDLYLLGLLNSALGFFYFRRTCAGLEGANEVYLRFFGQYLAGFPVPNTTSDGTSSGRQHDQMVSLVKSMLRLEADIVKAKTDQEKTALQRQIDTTDKQIDALVYGLYGLTEEEIKIVEAV
jgi:hypothetical protein